MLLSPANAPFAVALVLMILIGLVEAIGLGLGSVDVDASLHAEGDFLGWLGIGQVPLLILLILFLGLFAMVGFALQQLAGGLLGAPLSPWLAGPAAAALGLPLLGITARGAARILPRDETTAILRDSLIGKRATVTVGIARLGSPARARVIDQHGQPHFVMVEPTDERTAAGEGQVLLLVRREGDIFIGLAEGEELQLDIDDRMLGRRLTTGGLS
ncbi:OB-fold-containig protein [Sphingomonas sp. LHG3406-1]|uniref:OB-fold-containig protein n=1 Tax=Sphingomonas sp. LHG3406-1 TaxID=2804617 RepID=UPI0026169EBE|nr:OB-fold-containig protein [Sphingomonas sp. LHG3406-1]